MTRDEVLRIVADTAIKAGAAIFTGNGYNARALCALEDRPQFFYMLGSMGLCSTLAAGFAHRVHIPVIVVEGDGNALMGLSGFPTAACAAKETFVHLVLDNALYETTGGQRTLSSHVDFGQIARGTGYERVVYSEDSMALRTALETAIQEPQRTFVYVRTQAKGSPIHPRVPYHPQQIVRRFRTTMVGLDTASERE